MKKQNIRERERESRPEVEKLAKEKERPEVERRRPREIVVRH